MKHVIQKQRFEISAPDVEHARHVQQFVSDLLYSSIIPLMDETFSDYSDDNTRIRVDKLELDLGEVVYEDFDQHFIQKMRTILRNTLEKEVSRQARQIQSPTSQKDKTATTQISEREQLEYFLETGQLPWWVAESASFDPDQSLSSLLKTDPQAIIELLTGLAGTPAIERLAKQLSSATHLAILDTLASSTNQQIIKRHIAFWEHLQTSIPELPFEVDKQNISGDILSLLLENIELRSSGSLLQEALNKRERANLSKLDTQQLTAMKQFIREQSSQTGAETKLWYADKLALINAQQAYLKPTDTGTGQPATRQSASVDQPTPDHDGQPDGPTQEKPVSSRNKPRAGQRTEKSRADIRQKERGPSQVTPQTQTDLPESESAAIEISGEPCYIPNAGLILLWPFLQRYFTTLALLEDSHFVSTHAQERAVLLLHYLQTGDTLAYEHTLLLNKLLCAWPPRKPLAASITPSRQEQQETTALLESVIQHWKALKNTSIDGLRQTFLQREGRLVEKEHGWELLISRRGFDVLLDQLPWGIGTIHLPWMKKTVFTEW